MAQGIAYGGFVDRGPDTMNGYFSPSGTVNFGSIVGPAAGMAVSERSSVNRVGKMTNGTNDFSSMVTIPIVLAAGFLLWYALKTYD